MSIIVGGYKWYREKEKKRGLSSVGDEGGGGCNLP